MEQFYAVSPPGLEAILSAELSKLGLAPPLRFLRESQRNERVGFQGSLESLYRANLWLRSAERVLWRLGSFPAADFAQLRYGAKRLPWDEFLAPGRAVAVRADCRRSKLYHERAVAERVAEAAGRPQGSPEQGAQRVFVSVEDDQCSVDLDASGEPLHKRGYRLAGAKAPLRETLAAALLLSCGWERAPLLDPFCGSGTILIEAALLALNAAPGRARRFAFMDWPSFDPALWARLLAQASGAASGAPPLAGSDRDAGAIAAARANAERAGVAPLLELSCRAVSAAQPPAGKGWVVSNPPYGRRVDGGDARDVYAQLGKMMRERCPGWRAALLCASVPMARATGLPFAAGPSTKNGGLDVRIALL